MIGMLTIFGRLLTMLLGYAAGCLAASLFLNIMLLATTGFPEDGTLSVGASALVFSVPFIALFVAYFAFVPAMPVILLAEVLGRRDWLFYALGGAIVGGVVATFFSAATNRDNVGSDPVAAATMVAAGIVGAVGYWLVAGRMAGAWRRRPASTSPGQSES